MKFIKKNLWEIERSPALLILGSLLSALHIINYFFWSHSSSFMASIEGPPLLCWQFFSQCTDFKLIPGSFASAFLVLYLIFAILGALVFMSRRFAGFAWFCLFFATLLKTLFYVQDASLESNYQNLLLLINICFLIIPNKSSLIRLLVFVGYLMMGFYKLSPEWLAGVTIPARVAMPLKGYEWLAVFSVLIEIIMPWLLISRIRVRFLYGFAALFGYHLIQLYFTHHFDHIAAPTILVFLAFEHFEQVRKDRESFYRSYEHPEPSKFWWPVAIGAFVLAQLPTGNETLLRVFKIEKMGSYSECQQVAFVHAGSKIEQLDLSSDEEIAMNLRCHPTVAFNKVKSLCAKLKKEADFQNITSFFLQRQLAEKEYRLVFGSDRFCDSTYTAENMGGR